MSQLKDKNQVLSRREALKALAASTGAVALSTVPARWQKPVVKIGTLPAFAQASPVKYPFTNTVEVRVEKSGTELAGATWFEDQGWVGVYIPDGSSRLKTQEAGGKRPWRRLQRLTIGPPFWPAGPIIVFISLTFKLASIKPGKLPKGKIFCYGYGRFGGEVYNGLLEGYIANGQVNIAFPLPDGFTGFFFFSCFFPTFVILEDDSKLDATFYFGPCLYGPNSPFASDDDEENINEEIEDPNEVILGNFKIIFKGVTYAGDKSEWKYKVEELSAPPHLSKWVLELPLLEECATIIDSSPVGTPVNPDPDSRLTGIQWVTDTGFSAGEFTVTLSGDVVVGIVKVAVKEENNNVIIGRIAGPVCQEAVDEVTLPNCFRIVFLGATDNKDGTSTWRYVVEELACAQDLSNWVLALPLNCTKIKGAWPAPWEQVSPDPNAQLTGIKWETGAGFNRGTFEVTLEGTLGVELGVGMVEVAAKGPDVEIGEINGPVCLSNDN